MELSLKKLVIKFISTLIFIFESLARILNHLKEKEKDI